MPRAVRVIRNSLLIAVISFALGEIALHAYNFFRPNFVFYDSSYNRFRRTPGALDNGFPLNSGGFKDVECATTKGGRCRIVALGDSFAYGVVPYPNNYLTILESELGRLGRPAEVVNMGIPGIGPADYLALLVAEGLVHDPDLVLVTFCLGNDFQDSLRSARRNQELWEYSYVATLLRFITVIRPRYQGSNVYGRKPYNDSLPTFSKQQFLEVMGRRSSIFLTGWPEFDAAFAQAVADLGKIQRICQRRGIPLAVAVAPEEIQLDPELQRELTANFADYGAGEVDFLRPYRLLVESLEASGIDVIDLLEPFSVHHRPDHPLYKPRDTHWNIAGNRLAAEVIAARIATRQPCPAQAPGSVP